MLLFFLAAFLFANDTAAKHARGLALYQDHKYPEAITLLETAIASERPGTAEYGESALLIGQSYYLLGQPSKAIPFLEKVAGVREANYMLGYAYMQTGRLESSVAAFARAFGEKPGSAAAYLVAGQMLLKEQDEEHAAAAVLKAIAINPAIPQAHFLLAEIDIRHEQNDRAFAHLKEELRLDPDYSMAWYRLGDIYVRQQKYDLAIPNLQRAVWLSPGYSGPYILLGKCYLRQSLFQKAIAILQTAQRLDPQNRQAIYLLGQALTAVGRSTEGKTLLQQLHYSSGNP